MRRWSIVGKMLLVKTVKRWFDWFPEHLWMNNSIQDFDVLLTEMSIGLRQEGLAYCE